MLKIFNTLTCKKEIFHPIIKNIINLYVCGVTVYDFCHIGHGRTFVVFDMIVRYLRHNNFKVKYIRNITDVDDKIIQKAIKEKVSIKKLTDFMIKAMHNDFSTLGLLAPDLEPRVTDCIHEIISIILELVNKKYAYINSEGDVLFSVKSDLNYGILSNQSVHSLKTGTRILIKNKKNNPLDFILWKNAPLDEYSWDSPWGKGRPGWHIECSAITNIYFKNILDIHGGGSDLLFPHHENERAQSELLQNKLKVNFWIHTGMVIINNKKMSKSLGNVYFLKDILLYYDAETVRFFFLSTHYRHPIYYSEKNLCQARLSLEHLYITLSDTFPTLNFSYGMNFEIDFFNAINDDFNTPQAFSILFQLSHKINFWKNKDFKKANLLAFRLSYLAGSLGFLLQNPVHFLQKKYIFNKKTINYIETLIQKRNVFRTKKLWKEADDIRTKLSSMGIIIEDLPKKTIWRKK